MKRARRKPRLSRLDRDRLADRLHLLADGDHAECRNPFAKFAAPAYFAELWPEYGAGIVERWRETGHQPSSWWRWVAGCAGVAVPRIAA